MSKVAIIALWIIVIVTVSGCRSSDIPTPQSTPSSQASGTYQTLTIDEFADILVNRSDSYTVVNVHIPYEGEVENTDMSVAYNDIEALMEALPNRDAPIILYCRSGRMSEEAAQMLANLGYSELWDVPGGMNAWKASGRELFSSSPA